MASIPLLRLSLPARQLRPSAVVLPRPLQPPTLRLPEFRLRRLKARMCCESSPAARERLISGAFYLLPMMDSLQLGKFLYDWKAVEPMIRLSIPFVSMISFTGLCLGVVLNPRFSRYVRFNAQQVFFLQQLVHLLTVVEMAGITPPPWAYSGVFLFVAACFIYAVVSTFLGRIPHLPLFGYAAARLPI